MSVKLSTADRWKRYWYLQSAELWLEPMPGKRRRAAVEELKANLSAAAGDVGMDAAIRDLGRPRALAAQYLEQEPTRRPRWTRGAFAAGAVVAVWVYATLFYTLGMLEALESSSSPTPARGSFLGTHVIATYTDREISAAFDGWPWGPLVVMAVAFLVASRAWHALPRRSDRQLPAVG